MHSLENNVPENSLQYNLGTQTCGVLLHKKQKFLKSEIFHHAQRPSSMIELKLQLLKITKKKSLYIFCCYHAFRQCK